jgi:hypothetical protein
VAASEFTPEKDDAAREEVEVERLKCPEEPDWTGVEELLDTGKAESESERCKQQNPEFPEIRYWFEKARQRKSWLTRMPFGEDFAQDITAVGDEKQNCCDQKAGGSGFEKHGGCSFRRAAIVRSVAAASSLHPHARLRLAESLTLSSLRLKCAAMMKGPILSEEGRWKDWEESRFGHAFRWVAISHLSIVRIVFSYSGK